MTCLATWGDGEKVSHVFCSSPKSHFFDGEEMSRCQFAYALWFHFGIAMPLPQFAQLVL